MREVSCPHCTYKWKTKSKLNMVTCPSCSKKFSTKENKEENSQPQPPNNNIAKEKEDHKVSLGY